MKKLMAALLLLVAMSSVAAAQSQPFIGLYADDTAVLCEADLTPFVPMNVYVFAVLPETDIPAITAAEFRIDNLPGPAAAIITPTWNTTLVIGTMGHDLALAFTPPLPGPVALLGTLQFLALADLGADFRMTIMPGNDCNCLVVVDTDYIEWDCEPDHFFTFNCTGALEYGCNCQPTIATEDATWGQIKALY